MLTQAQLQSILNYNSDTGIFTWKISKSGNKGINSLAGCLHKKSKYYYICINYKHYKLHRLAWLYVYGEWPNIIDHIDGNPSNNKISNLRNCNRQENMCNQKLRKDNTTGVKGIRFAKHGKWRVLITSKKIKNHIGYFDDFFEACCAAYSARNKLHGNFVRHN